MVQFSCSGMSDSLRPHELQHARPPCPSPTPGVYSNSCQLSQWCHLAISSSVIPFSCPQSLPASGSFQMSQFSASGGQSIGVSAFSISPSSEHPGLISFRMDWLDLLAVQGTLKSLLQHHSSKASILLCSAFFIVQLSHLYVTTGKTVALTRWTFVICLAELIEPLLAAGLEWSVFSCSSCTACFSLSTYLYLSDFYLSSLTPACKHHKSIYFYFIFCYIPGTGRDPD